MPKRSTTPDLQYATSSQDWKPHAYQRKAVKWLLEHAGAGLFLDPGLGKTSITLAALKILKKQRVSGKTVVVAPLRVCHNVWPKEVEKWNDFKHMKVEVLHGARKEERLWNSDADIFVINPEGLEWLFGVTKQRMLNGKTRVDVDAKRCKRLFDELEITDLVVDESTKFKSSNSQRFKILKMALGYFRRRWILTGTPAPNGLMDLFSQIFIIDQGAALGQYITHYRARFFDPTGFGGFNYRVKPGAEQEIYKLLKRMVLRLDAKDYLELPEVILNPIKFDLPPEAQKFYDELEDDFVVDMDDKRVTAMNSGTSISKLAQIANGGIYEQEDPLVKTKRKKDAWRMVHSMKDEIVFDIVDELGGQPVMIAYEFAHDLARLRAIFGDDTPYIGGGVSPTEGKRIEDRWNRGQIPVLLVQPQAAAHGLNMQGASSEEIGHIIWYGLTYDYELFEQLIKRLARQGSKHKKVLVHMIMARETVDVAKFYALRAKDKTQGALLNALRVYVKERAARRAVVAQGLRKGGAGRASGPQARPRAPGGRVGAGRPRQAPAGRPAGRKP